MTIARHLMKASLALLAIGSIGVIQSANAAGTASNTSITNRATVSYSVGGVAQTAIQSSPTGNTSATGSDTTFVVDNKVIQTVAPVAGAAIQTVPGATNVVAAFTVTNTGNTAQGYLLTPTNAAAGTASPFGSGSPDNSDVGNLRVFVDSGAGGTLNSYDASDTATSITTLAPDTSVRVYILSDVPLTATNNQYANVQLAARATTTGTATPVTQTAGADSPAAVDIVFADTGVVARDGIAEGQSQYLVQSATLTVTKTSSVFSDPFNNTTNPKAIPGAIVQYTITVANTGASSATGVTVSDPIPTNTDYVAGSITVNGSSVSDTGKTVGTPVTSLNVDPGAIAASGTATVTFRVTIK
jgi:uncharacterized repeat protein (TIGR01451 family)